MCLWFDDKGEFAPLLPADEFVDMVRERYGFEAPTGDPALWMRMFVEILALTETYLGYGEPVDFPFAECLPPLALR